jgi:hypothetical protein
VVKGWGKVLRGHLLRMVQKGEVPYKEQWTEGSQLIARWKKKSLSMGKEGRRVSRELQARIQIKGRRVRLKGSSGVWDWG